MSKQKPAEGLPIFSEQFKKLRGEQNQDAFARFLGVSRQTVGFYESGARIPDALTLLRIAQKCEVTTDYLLGLTGNKTPETAYVEKTLGLSTEAIEAVKGDTGICAAVNDLFSSAEQLKKVIPETTALVVKKGLDALSFKIISAAKHPEEYNFVDLSTDEGQSYSLDAYLLEMLLGFRLWD